MAAPLTVAVCAAPEPTVYSTCACVWSEPSGWFGTHETVMLESVGATPDGVNVTVGASGGVMVVIAADSVHADASEPRRERARKRTVPPPTSAVTGNDA